MNILEKYSKLRGPLPTPRECLEALQNPEAADPRIKEYLRLSPNYARWLRSVLQMEEEIERLLG